MHPDDEILIQYDEERVSKAVMDYLNVVSSLTSNHKVISFPLNNDFATFKNNLKNHASGIFIFNIDADEYPHPELVENIRELLEVNKETDLFFVPRINTVDGLTQSHVDKWGWKIDRIQNHISEKELDSNTDEYLFLKSNNCIISEENGMVKYYTPIINLPDVQTRIYRRTSEIQWVGKVHERIAGYNTISVLPYEERYCLYHPKGIERQERQNEFYEGL
jgi:glycosyltransferase involved in cell wall biosynthesis